MGIIWERISRLKLRNKLALGFAIGFVLLLGISFYAIYQISERYRSEEFYQRLQDRTISIYKLVVEVEQIDYEMLQLFERNTINSLYEEKILLFNDSSRLIYTSIDDTKVYYPEAILQDLEDGAEEVQMRQGKYETLGLRFSYNGKQYFGIAKAYDRFGHSKLAFLKWLLIGTFLVVTLLLVFLSLFLSRIITRPITKLAREIDGISSDSLSTRVEVPLAKDEVGFLADKFNELLERVDSSFKFQYHFINHLSHELKTPLAVMMANTERALSEANIEGYERSLSFQKKALMDLSHIINALLDISKTETLAATVLSEQLRIDELLFECMDEVTLVNPDVRFDLKIDEQINSAEYLTVIGNNRMLKMAIINLLKNAGQYAVSELPVVSITSIPGFIDLSFQNDGPVLDSYEQGRLFQHLFRGVNSRGVKGFGLGLVLTRRIITLHRGLLTYHITGAGRNCFSMRIPLVG